MREGQLPGACKASMLTGGYHLLLQFSISVGKRVPDMPLYALFLIPMLAVFALLMIAMASKPTARATSRIAASVDQQMKLSAKPVVKGEDRPVDVTDETVPKDDVRDFPVSTLADIRQSVENGDARRFASRLAS